LNVSELTSKIEHLTIQCANLAMSWALCIWSWFQLLCRIHFPWFFPWFFRRKWIVFPD